MHRPITAVESLAVLSPSVQIRASVRPDFGKLVKHSRFVGDVGCLRLSLIGTLASRPAYPGDVVTTGTEKKERTERAREEEEKKYRTREQTGKHTYTQIFLEGAAFSRQRTIFVRDAADPVSQSVKSDTN